MVRSVYKIIQEKEILIRLLTVPDVLQARRRILIPASLIGWYWLVLDLFGSRLRISVLYLALLWNLPLLNLALHLWILVVVDVPRLGWLPLHV